MLLDFKQAAILVFLYSLGILCFLRQELRRDKSHWGTVGVKCSRISLGTPSMPAVL